VENERKVFHSLRHTFKDALRAANVGEDLNDALCRQKNGSVGRSYGAKQRSGAKDIVRRFGMLRLKAVRQKQKYRAIERCRAGEPGFEPRLAESESADLHDVSMGWLLTELSNHLRDHWRIRNFA
jgi:hypothetical protein